MTETQSGQTERSSTDSAHMAAPTPGGSSLVQRGDSSGEPARLGADPARAGTPRWHQALALLLIAAFSIVLRARLAPIPLERDEGEYAYIAQRWLAGDIPYRDAFDQKPPGVFLVYAGLFALVGDSIEAIHWLGHASLLGALGFLYLIGRLLFSHTVGWVAALAGVVFVMDSSVLGNASNTEVFAILPLTAGMYFALVAAGGGGLWHSLGNSLGAGICGGLALCFKQVTLPAVAFYAGLILLGRWWPSRAARNDTLLGGGSSQSPGLADEPSFADGQACPSHGSPLVLEGAFVIGICLVLIPTGLYFAVHGA